VTDADLVALYVLSGGNPGVIERTLADARLPESRKRLLKGAGAFVRGDKKSAREDFQDLEPDRFPDALAARVLMVQAQIQDDLPYVVRRDKLAKAASLALGTLIEEAANRRLVSLAASFNASRDFMYWSDRYVRRFPKSLYFGDFGQDFIDGIRSFDKSSSAIGTPWLEGVFDRLDRDKALIFAARLQQVAVSHGSSRLCAFGQRIAVKLQLKDRRATEKFQLYNLVCQVSSSPSGLDAKLKAIDRQLLDGPDKALLSSANALLEGIRAENSLPPLDVYGPKPENAGAAIFKSIEASVAQQMGATDEVLKKVKP
jgi:chemotaxis protein MotC